MRTERPTPYVGITGFMSRTEVDAAIDAMPAWGSKRLLQVGVLASPKSLWAGGNTKPHRYPKPWAIQRIWNYADTDATRYLNVLHWCAEPHESALDQLETAIESAGPLDGVQVNAERPIDRLGHIPLPDRVIVQARPNVMKLGAKWIAEYLEANPRVTDVLLDSSAGTGAGIDFGLVLTVLDELIDLCPTLGIVIAGGLSAKALRRPGLREFLREHPFVSIDAESGLRDGNDKLDLTELRAYLDEAAEIFSE